ncbi:MAG: EamA family transporter [Oscillatoriales cyanobacterium]|nr:MAG: EamA family transporter [Oscillatoriales cyanobacterium]
MELPHLNAPSSSSAPVSAESAGESVPEVIPPTVISFLTIAPFFFWGTAMVAMKSVMPHTSPLFVAGFRLVPAGILVLLAAAIAGRPQPQGWKAWGWIGLFAVIDATLFQGFLAEGLQRTGAGIGSVTIDSQPLIVAVLSWVLWRERIGWIGWLGLAIGVIGIAAIGLPIEWLAVHATRLSTWAATLTGSIDATSAAIQAEIQSEMIFGVGEGLMLLASLSMAIGTVMMPKISEHVDPLVATGWHMILGGLPLFLCSASLETEQWQNLLPAEWAALIYSTIFGSAIAYGLFFYFAARQNLISLSSLTFLTPVFALFFGYLLLSETLTLQQWFGVGLTLLGVYVIGQRHAWTMDDRV